MFKNQNSAQVVATQAEQNNKSFFVQTRKDSNLFEFTPRRKKAQEKLRRHFIFRCLITACRNEKFEQDENGLMQIVYDLPDLSKSANFGLLDDDEIYSLGICPVPTEIQNIMICRKLEKLFGDLSICNCFVKTETSWLLDISPYLAKQGLFLPIKNAETGLIERLLVYRRPDDPRPFRLQLQGGTGING